MPVLPDDPVGSALVCVLTPVEGPRQRAIASSESFFDPVVAAAWLVVALLVVLADLVAGVPALSSFAATDY